MKTLLDRVWIWAFLYLLLVPGFAVAYQVLPFHSFYDSTVQREPSVATQAATLGSDLSYAMSSRIRNNAEWYSPAGTLQLKSLQVDVAPIQSSGTGLQIDISGTEADVGIAALQQQGGFVETYALDLTTDPDLADNPRGTLLDGVLAVVSTPTNSSFEPPITILFPTASGETQISTTSAIFYMPPSTYGELEDFYLASQGDPKTASDPFLRMLYFSTITVTTLGFGDITPVSGEARLLVGLEAILGVVLVGLFLNALGRRIGKDRSSANSEAEGRVDDSDALPPNA